MDRFQHVRIPATRIVMLLMMSIFMYGSSTQAELLESESSPSKKPAATISAVVKQLQGKWKVVKLNGKDCSNFDGPAIRFRDNKVIEIMPSENKERLEEEVGQETFTVDESKNPMWIDVGKRKGIFGIEDDLLIVCLGDKKCRPTKITLANTTDVGPVTAARAYPSLPSRDPAIGFWVPFELSWDQNEPDQLVLKKVR